MKPDKSYCIGDFVTFYYNTRKHVGQVENIFYSEKKHILMERVVTENMTGKRTKYRLPLRRLRKAELS